MSDVFRALSDPTRRAILRLLRERPMTAGELADQFTISKPAMSAHFAILREADLVASDRVGKTLVYRLRLSVLEEAMLTFADAMGLGRSSQADEQSPRSMPAKDPR